MEREMICTYSDSGSVYLSDQEIVRCKDCAWHSGVYCNRYGTTRYMSEEDFCSKGKKDDVHSFIAQLRGETNE